MFTELHLHTDRDFRKLDLAEKMAERRKHSLAATRRSSLRARMARMLFAHAVDAGKHETWSTTRERSEAAGRA